MASIQQVRVPVWENCEIVFGLQMSRIMSILGSTKENHTIVIFEKGEARWEKRIQSSREIHWTS